MDRNRDRAPGSQRLGEEDGIALVLALLFVVLLTALVVDFSYEMQVEATLTESSGSDMEAYVAAKSAVALGLGLLAMDLLALESEPLLADLSNSDSLEDLWAEGVPLAPLNAAVMQCAIDDEYGKLNLNALVYLTASGEEMVHPHLERALRFLFAYREVEEDPVDAIIDWLDSDDEELEEGAENEYYTGLESPYTCKNGPMDSVEELLLIPGVTLEVYFGDEEEGWMPLTELLTVHGHPEGRLNVNTAEFEVLEAHFSADGDFPDPAEPALRILERLEAQGPFTEVGQLQEEGYVVRPDPAQRQGRRRGQSAGATGPQGGAGARQAGEEERPVMLDVSSSVFRLYGDGQCGDARVRIEAYAARDTADNGWPEMFRILDWRVIR